MVNRIHPTVILGDGVDLGLDNVIGPYSVVVGPCRIGDGNWIGPHVSIGGPAEYRGGPHPAGWEGELGPHGVEIGDGNIIREFASINGGTAGVTSVGDRCYLMSGAHVGHDSQIGDDVTITSAVQIAGHCRVWSGANLGMGTVVHQRIEIGPGAMVGMGSAVRKDIGPFTITVGDPARVVALNDVGLRRWGCDDDAIAAIEPYLKGKGDLPARLPEGIARLLKEWAMRADD
jgi:UDP-N-acetylglucosamine acyltransferase